MNSLKQYAYYIKPITLLWNVIFSRASPSPWAHLQYPASPSAGRAQVREAGCSRLQLFLNTTIQRQFPSGAGTQSVQRLPLALPANLLSCNVPPLLPLMNSLFHCNSYIKHLETRLVLKKKKTKGSFSASDLSRPLSERKKEFSWTSKPTFIFKALWPTHFSRPKFYRAAHTRFVAG